MSEGENMTLSNEQREEINKFMDETMYTFATLEERYDQIGTARRLINLLQSSEKALREENERLNREVNKYSDLAIHNLGIAARFESQHDQAIEMLTFIANGNIEFPSPNDAKDVLIDIRKLAGEFLSSLKESTHEMDR